MKPVVEEQKLRTRIPPHEGKLIAEICLTKSSIGEKDCDLGSEFEKKETGISETVPKCKSNTLEGKTGIHQTIQVSPKVSPNTKIEHKFEENPMEIDIPQETYGSIKNSSKPKKEEHMQTDVKDHHDNLSASTQESEEIIFVS